MNKYQYIIASRENASAVITLNRPRVHNALNIEMIREISSVIVEFNKDDDLRLIIIDANGENFSSGADIHWMKKGLEQSQEELEGESRELALLFNNIYNSPKVTIAVARGKVIGGANGIIAATDISLALPETTFMFSEVKLGLIPATIAPYIINRTGNNVAKEWMLTGREISLQEALERGLVNGILKNSDPAEELEQLKKTLLNNGPAAIKGVKELFRGDDLLSDPDDMIAPTASLIAKFRVSDEGQEGTRAFIEKRKPSWRNG
ncbi:MAG: enoyl-CoA hydratase/isomerase family protein [Bacteroidales bacterium]|nr:enoyl-CoA hydratase/isomerase family protein [Bacteroidales bacterium]